MELDREIQAVFDIQVALREQFSCTSVVVIYRSTTGEFQAAGCIESGENALKLLYATARQVQFTITANHDGPYVRKMERIIASIEDELDDAFIARFDASMVQTERGKGMPS